MSDQRYTDALLANGRLRDERDLLRDELEHHKQIATDLRSDNDRLREALEQAIRDWDVLYAKFLSVEAECDRLREALEKIEQWADAYPLDIFPEPDLKRAHEVLTANGMTLDSIAAKAERHIIEGVGKIARAALAKEVGK